MLALFTVSQFGPLVYCTSDPLAHDTLCLVNTLYKNKQAEENSALKTTLCLRIEMSGVDSGPA